MYNKEYKSEESQYELFHDIHLRIDDLLERASTEYTKKLNGALVAVKRKNGIVKLGKVTKVVFKIGSVKGKVTAIVYYNTYVGTEASFKLKDVFLNPAKDLSEVCTSSKYLISKDEDGLKAEIAKKK